MFKQYNREQLKWIQTSAQHILKLLNDAPNK